MVMEFKNIRMVKNMKEIWSEDYLRDKVDLILVKVFILVPLIKDYMMAKAKYNGKMVDTIKEVSNKVNMMDMENSCGKMVKSFKEIIDKERKMVKEKFYGEMAMKLLVNGRKGNLKEESYFETKRKSKIFDNFIYSNFLF